MYDIFNINMWKFKMSAYLKALQLHVYLATTKKSFVDNVKYLEATTQAMDVIKHTLRKNYLFMISHCDSAFTVWNTLTSLKEQMTNVLEMDLLEMSPTKYQGNDSPEVTSDTHLDDCASTSNDHDSSMDAHALNEELSLFCEDLLSKFKLLKKKSFKLKKKNEILFSKLDLVLEEKFEVSSERDSLKT